MAEHLGLKGEGYILLRTDKDGLDRPIGRGSEIVEHDTKDEALAAAKPLLDANPKGMEISVYHAVAGIRRGPASTPPISDSVAVMQLIIYERIPCPVKAIQESGCDSCWRYALEEATHILGIIDERSEASCLDRS